MSSSGSNDSGKEKGGPPKRIKLDIDKLAGGHPTTNSPVRGLYAANSLVDAALVKKVTAVLRSRDRGDKSKCAIYRVRTLWAAALGRLALWRSPK